MMSEKTAAVAGDDIFNSNNEMQPQSIDWGKVGDFVTGTKVGQRDNVVTKFGKNTLFEVKVATGTFTKKDGTVINVVPGEIWSVWGRNEIFDSQMKRMLVGQKFGLKFTEQKPSTKGNDSKIIKVFTTGAMDQEWLDARDAEAAKNNF